MSRTIKFRARRKDGHIFSAEEMGRDQLTLSVDGRGIVNVHSDPRQSEFYRHITPEQFTGQLDRNGREIFEGDRVRVAFEDQLWRVVWNEQFASWAIVGADDDRRRSLTPTDTLDMIDA
jgi:hypothetical protein